MSMSEEKPPVEDASTMKSTDGAAVAPKRGRKPRAAAAATKAVSVCAPASASASAEPAAARVCNGAQTQPATPAPAAKRGAARKPKAVYNGFEDAGTAERVTAGADDDNIIMQLNLPAVAAHAQEDALTACVPEPNAYNHAASDSFVSRPFELDMHGMAAGCVVAGPGLDPSTSGPCEGAGHRQVGQTNTHAHTHTQAHAPCKPRIVHLLRDFEEKNKNNEWPQTTHIACYWCCHRFDGPPFGLPVKMVDGKYHVLGCFCSLECAAAHNFASKDSMDDVWERYQLINMLSRAVGHKPVVKPAPNRLALKLFGGYLELEEFRAFCNTSKLLNINFPPMMTLTQQLEEVNESDINTDYRYVPLDNDRIAKYKEKIRLKRSKPITDIENTLDHTMALSFGKE